MADILFSNHPFHQFWTEMFSYRSVGLSIFLICAECAGVPAVVWCLTVLHRHHKSSGSISAFIILLLTSDLLELLLNLYIIAKLFQRAGCEEMTWGILSMLWSSSRICGVHLQQMVVLENILSLRLLFHSANVFSPPCSIISSIIAFICFFLCEFFRVPWFMFLTVLPLLAVTVTSWILSCRTPPNKTHRSNRTKNQKYVVLPFSLFTMILYLIFPIEYVPYAGRNQCMLSVCLSVRVIIDPLLCVMVCREKITQTHTDPKTDQTSVQAEQSV